MPNVVQTTAPQEVGRATGELCTAMGKVVVDMHPPIHPYWQLFEVHHAISRDKFYNEVATNSDFNVCRQDIDFLTGVCDEMQPYLHSCMSKSPFLWGYVVSSDVFVAGHFVVERARRA